MFQTNINNNHIILLLVKYFTLKNILKIKKREKYSIKYFSKKKIE